MNRIGLVRMIRRSLFLKLMLMFVGASLFAVLFVYFIFGYFVASPDREVTFRLENRTHYAELMVQEIGNPRDPNVAARLATQEGFALAIEGGGIHYRSNPSMLSVDELRQHAIRAFRVREAESGFVWGEIYLLFTRGEYQYLFLFPYDPVLRARPGLAGTLAFVLILLTFTTFLFLRRLLKPLRRLHEGVREISAGNLEHRITVENDDEFADLARSFNRMSTHISEMIRAKEQLLLDVSHELRSPLTRISVAMELEGADETIRKNIREMNSMITELLESARLDSTAGSLRLEKTDLSQLVTEVASQYENSPPGVKIMPLDRSFPLEVDPIRIRSVFQNVIENAVKYSPKDRRAVEVSFHPNGSRQLTVVVRDYGIGIPENEQSLVFEPFYRVDKSRCKESGGYGLGLSLARKIMRAHGGDLRIESVHHEGTRVSVVFSAK